MRSINYRFWTQEEIEFLISNYSNVNIPISTFEEKLNRTRNLIFNKARLLGLDRMVRVIFNEHYFDILDSWEKCYFIGLLWADGYNQIDKGAVRINLQENDAFVLEQFQKQTEHNGKLYHHKSKFSKGYTKPSKPQKELRFSSKHMSKTLELYGMQQNKTQTLMFPNIIPEQFMSAFCLGYFDGDGCICNSGNRNSFSIVGTFDIIKNYQQTLIKNLSISPTKILSGKSIYHFRVSKKEDVLKIKHWLYKDSTIFLERKYIKFQQVN